MDIGSTDAPDIEINKQISEIDRRIEDQNELICQQHTEQKKLKRYDVPQFREICKTKKVYLDKISALQTEKRNLYLKRRNYLKGLDDERILLNGQKIEETHTNARKKLSELREVVKTQKERRLLEKKELFLNIDCKK